MHRNGSSHIHTINRKLVEPERSGYVSGDIEAVPGDEASDVYVIVRHKQKNANGEARAQQ